MTTSTSGPGRVGAGTVGPGRCSATWPAGSSVSAKEKAPLSTVAVLTPSSATRATATRVRMRRADARPAVRWPAGGVATGGTDATWWASLARPDGSQPGP